jgi:hypothetical protein
VVAKSQAIVVVEARYAAIMPLESRCAAAQLVRAASRSCQDAARTQKCDRFRGTWKKIA